MVQRNLRHGHAFRGATSPQYRLWCAIINRCYTPTCTIYRYYGGRGIKIADEWRTFQGFLDGLAALGPKPSPKHTLDRIDSDDDYRPGNVRWATMTEQARNQRSNRIIEYHGRRMCVAEWAEALGLPYFALIKRFRRGWTVEEAFSLQPSSSQRIKTLRKKGVPCPLQSL